MGQKSNASVKGMSIMGMIIALFFCSKSNFFLLILLTRISLHVEMTRYSKPRNQFHFDSVKARHVDSRQIIAKFLSGKVKRKKKKAQLAPIALDLTVGRIRPFQYFHVKS